MWGKTVLFVGDSLTEGFGVHKDQVYPALLKSLIKKRLKKDIQILNGSVSGSTSASGLSRLKWFTKKNPDILVLGLGANDGLRGVKIGHTKKNLEKTIVFAKEKKIKVLLLGVYLPPNYGKSFSKAFQQMFKDLSKKYKIGLVPYMLDKVGGVEKYNQPDGLHPNELGQKIIAETIYPELIKLL